ncbi:TPA: hypothetical protein ACH3X3_003289 [Trebouxia sp. C0006]
MADQVIQPQEALAGTCPLLRIQLQTASADNIQLCEQHLIPWVSTIVQRIHSQSRTITIAPPAGLLELGRQQVLLDQLRPELIAYGEAAPDSMAARLGQHYMPTKRQLADAGREDLIKRVIFAGGFIHVAHLLGLRAKRKPEGYWDEPENMDRELSLFVAGTWTCLHDASSGEPYYYNQVTGRTQWDLPQTPQSIPLDDAGTFIFAEADADRVMPSRSAVLAAGRFDLHHGIMYQGGYKATAASLDRPHTWPRHKKFDTAAQLAEELRAFNREEGLPIDFIPTANALRGAERHDLLAGIRQLGGALTLAPQIGMKTQRGSGFYSTVSVAKELLMFVKQLHKDSGDTGQSWLMPSVYQLRQAGRHDLAAGVYKFGLGQVAQAAALMYNRTRKPSQCTANQLEKHLCDDIKEQSFSQNRISSNCAPVADQHDIAHEIR